MPETITFERIENVEIFSVGTWKGSRTVTVTSQMLDDMVRAFVELQSKVTGFRPPLKLGHADAQKFVGQGGSGAPALGWVEKIWRVGDKVLANFEAVPSSLLEMIRQRLYNSVSIELLPRLEYGEAVYQNVLAAVAVLGAELPAVKGLKELSATLFDDASIDRVALNEKDEGTMAGETTGARYTQEQVDALIAAALGKAATEFAAAHKSEVDTATAAVTAATAATKTEKERADRAEVALTTFKADASTASITAAVDAAIAAGKALPKEKDELIAFGASLDASKKIKFGTAERTPLDQWLAQLGARPKAVAFTETMNGNKDANTGKADAEVDQKAKAKVVAAGGDTKLTYAAAVQVVFAEDPALKQRYFNGE